MLEQTKRIPRSPADYADAVSRSQSAAAALRILGLVPAGGNYVGLYDRIRRHRLNTAHWLGQGHLKGKSNPFVRKIPLESILVRDSSYRGATSLLRSRLVKEGVLSGVCSQCGVSEWRGQDLTLHLDHVNGNHYDNRLENLRLLCPNCHSQTETYCGRNKRLRRVRQRGHEHVHQLLSTDCQV